MRHALQLGLTLALASAASARIPWTERGYVPIARNGVAACRDAAPGRTILFGGYKPAASTGATTPRN